MMNTAESINSIIGEIARLSKGELIVSILVGGVVVLCIYFWFRKQLKKALDEISTKINEVDARFTNVGTEINGVSEKFTNVGDQISGVGDQISGVGKHFSKVGTQIGDIDKHFSKVGAQIGDIDKHFSKVGTQIGDIDKHFSKVGTQIGDIDKHFSNFEEKLDAYAKPMPMPSQGGVHHTSLSNEHNTINAGIREIIKKQRRDADRMKEISDKGIDVDQMKSSIDLIIASHGSALIKNRSLEERSDKLAERCEALLKESQQMQKENQSLIQKLETLSEENVQLKQRLAELEKTKSVPAQEARINDDEWER